MNSHLFTLVDARAEWVRRFAYRAMLCRNEIDTTSAMAIADSQFDPMQGSDPETAAEGFLDRASHPAVPRSPYRTEPDAVRHSVGSLATA
jgi:hypothetical protein